MITTLIVFLFEATHYMNMRDKEPKVTSVHLFLLFTGLCQDVALVTFLIK
jgi:hypothetical protein